MMPLERPTTLALVWPPAQSAPPVSADLHFDFTPDRAAFEAVQAAAGWQMPPDQWAALQTEWLPGSMVLLRESGVAVAAACALRRTDDWIELAWVAVVPGYRGRGLGQAICAALTRRVLSLGHTRLFGSTQDTRLAALRIYLTLGFVPVHRAEKVARWQSVCTGLGITFSPMRWGWPALSLP
jgi:mycothiol synthase